MQPNCQSLMYLMMRLASLLCSERDGNELLEINDRLALYQKSEITGFIQGIHFYKSWSYNRNR